MAKAKKKAERPTIYKEVTAELYDGQEGRPLIDGPTAKEMLGWETEESAGVKFKDGEWLIKDRAGNKVRQTNNDFNRPLYQSNTEALLQEQLAGRWQFNGVPIIITNTGRIGNGQHTLTAVALGNQDIEADPDKWGDKWSDGLAIPMLVVRGIPEDDAILNTIDMGKPRSLSDVLYRSDMLKDVRPDLRRSLAPILSAAVRVLWERTGAMRSVEAYAPKRTVGEMLDFLARHEKLVKAAKHIWENDEGGKLSKYVLAGTASALMYLMASSTSSLEKYAETRRETKLKFDMWKQAQDYFTLLRDQPELKAVRDAIEVYKDPDTGKVTITPQERIGIVIRGWLAYLQSGKVTAKDVKLSYRTDEDDGKEYLAEFPTIGGIDLGPLVNQADDDETEVDAEEVEEQNEMDTQVEAEMEEELQSMGDTDYSATEEVEEMIETRKSSEGPKKEKPKKKKAKAKAGD